MTQEELQAQQSSEETTGGGIAKAVATFAAYGYAYNQFDNLTTGMINSSIAGSQTAIRLPFIKGFGEGKNINGRFGFTTNTFKTMDKTPVTQSQVLQMLTRGDKNSLEMLKSAGVDDEIITAFTPKIKNKIPSWMKTDLNGRQAVKHGLAEQSGNTAVMDDIVEGLAKKRGVEVSAMRKAIDTAKTNLKNSQLQPDVKSGVGLVIKSSVAGKGSLGRLGALTLRGVGTGLGIWYNPYTQMAIKPSLETAATVIKENMGGKRKENFAAGIVESQQADVSAENTQSLQIGKQKAYQDQAFAAGLMAAGREVDKYMQGLYSQQGQSYQPGQYRKNYR